MSETSKLIARRHPEYDGMVPRWDFWLESYQGGDDYINETNLFRYFKEGKQEYDQRKARAYRENHCRWCIDLINTYLFKSDVVRKTKNAHLQEFFDNFDGKGNPIESCMKTNSQYSSALGRVYIVVDKKHISDDKKTGTQADNLTNKPYTYRVFPQNVLDLAKDEAGALKWILIKEERRDDDNPFTSSGDIKTVYRLWQKGGWTLYDESGKEIESAQTGMPVIPIVVLNNEARTQYTGQSLIADIAPLDRAIFNNWSRLDTIVNDQAFSQLIYPVEGLPQEIVEDDELRNKFLVMATSRVLFYHASAGVPPAFIAPDAAQAEFILSMIETQTKQLYAMLGLQGETGTEVNEQSGVAKAYDFDKIDKLLTSKAKNLENTELEITEIWKLWMNVSVDDIEIQYPDEFDIKGLIEEITEAERLTEMNISSTLNKELYKNIAAKALPKAGEDVIKKIYAEIDDMTAPKGEAEKVPRFDFDFLKQPPGVQAVPAAQ